MALLLNLDEITRDPSVNARAREEAYKSRHLVSEATHL